MTSASSSKAATLFIGNDSESDDAVKAINDAGLKLRIFDKTNGQFEFDTPLLITAWGVFEGLSSISWFAKVAEQQKELSWDAALGD